MECLSNLSETITVLKRHLRPRSGRFLHFVTLSSAGFLTSTTIGGSARSKLFADLCGPDAPMILSVSNYTLLSAVWSFFTGRPPRRYWTLFFIIIFSLVPFATGQIRKTHSTFYHICFLANDQSRNYRRRDNLLLFYLFYFFSGCGNQGLHLKTKIY